MSGIISASGSSDSHQELAENPHPEMKKLQNVRISLHPPPYTHTHTHRPHSLTSMILKVLLFKVGFQLLLSLPFLLHLLLLQLTSNGLQIPQNHIVTHGVDKYAAYKFIFKIAEIGHLYRKQLVSLTKIKKKNTSW